MNSFLKGIFEQVGGDAVTKVDAEYRGKPITFYVREMSGAQAQEIYGPLNTDDEAAKKEYLKNIQNVLVESCVVNADGSAAFKEGEAKDAPIALLNIFRDNVLRINGLLDKTDKEDKAHEKK